MDELEQEYPLFHPEYSPVLTFLYQNLPFISITVGTASNFYAITRLQNSPQLPIRGLAMLWCSCNVLSILVVESLFALEMHSEGWYLGDFVCRLSKSFSVLPVCVNPWFLAAAVLSFSRLLPLRGYVTWLIALLIICPAGYMFYAFGHLETHFDDEHNTTISSCVHIASRDSFYWVNILSYIFYFNTPLVVIFCCLVFSHQLQQNKTHEWRYCFKVLGRLFLAQVFCWLPHWVDLFYMIKANDEFSNTTLAFLVVEFLVFVHIGLVVPRELTQLALHYADYSVHENPFEPPVVEMQGVNEIPPRDWP